MKSRHSKNIIILYASAGGGHKSVAEALQTAFISQYGKDIVVELVDVLDAAATPKALTKIPELYPKVSKVPEVYNFIYNITNGQLRNRFIVAFNWLYGKNALTSYLSNLAVKPDLIITTFAFIGSVMINAVENIGTNIPVATVITDWGEIHSSWFDSRMAVYFTPTALAKKSGLANNIPAGRIHVSGYPTDRHFVPISPDERRLRRAKYKMGEDDFVVLLFGSQIGSDEIANSAKLIQKVAPQIKFLAIAGRNEILQEKLKLLLPAQSTIFGFVDHEIVAEAMNCVDVMISKSGGATIAEAINTYLPMVVYGYALEQERENTDFVVNAGIGRGAASSDEIAEEIEILYQNPHLLAQMRTKITQIAHPQAALEIAKSLKKYL